MGVLSADYEPDLFGEFMRPEEQHSLERQCRDLCMDSDMCKNIYIHCSFFYEEESFRGTVLNWSTITIILDSEEANLPCWMVFDEDIAYNLAKHKILKIIHEYPCYIAVAGYPIPDNNIHPVFEDPRPDHPYEEMIFPYYTER